MLIVADENIPYVREAFAPWGEVRRLPANAIDNAAVRAARVLLVRSVTPVNDALLEGSAIEFAATATIGTDHVDIPALVRRGVGFASAPGSNAVSVAEWAAAALLALAGRHDRVLSGLTLGVVGVGNVGSRVAALAEALGMRALRCDPPRARAGESGFVALDALLDESDFVTLHVPLIREGADRTLNLADEVFFARLTARPGRFFLNSSRGGVVAERALRDALASGALAGAALDVWRGEPAIDAATLEAASIATPHIAGYSFDGKVEGARMIHDAARRHFAARHFPVWDPTPLLPPPVVPEVPILAAAGASESAAGLEAALRSAVGRVYDIDADDAALRATVGMTPEERGKAFTRLRKNYPVRREFRFTRAKGAEGPLRRLLAGLGFRVDPEEKRIDFVPDGVCASRITVWLSGGVIARVEMHDACDGNTKGLARLAAGRRPEEVAALLRGIDCDGKGTSCPDQLARALEKARQQPVEKAAWD